MEKKLELIEYYENKINITIKEKRDSLVYLSIEDDRDLIIATLTKQQLGELAELIDEFL